MHSGFAKPASRNTFVEDVPELPFDPTYHGIDPRKNRFFREERRGRGDLIGKANAKPLRLSASAMELKTAYTRGRYNHHHSSRESKEEPSGTLDESNMKGLDSLQRPLSAVSYISRTNNSTPASLTARTHDALEIFDHFGISRPKGWLSEDEPATVTNLSPPRPKLQRICHSCGELLRDRKHCPHCGHDSCDKCTSDTQDDQVDSHTIGDAYLTYAKYSSGHSHHASEEKVQLLPSPHAASCTTEIHIPIAEEMSPEESRQETSRRSMTKEVIPHPTISWLPNDDILPEMQQQPEHKGVSARVRNNPFLVADRAFKGDVVEAEPTMRTVQAERSPHVESPHFSDCVPQIHGQKSSPGSPSSGKCSNPSCRATHAGFHPFRHSISCGSKHKLSIPKQFGGSEGDSSDQAEESTGLQRSLEPLGILEKQVKQLHQHARDLHHSQHIMEHLTAGSKALDQADAFPRKPLAARRAELREKYLGQHASKGTSGNVSPIKHSLTTDVRFLEPIDTKTHLLRQDLQVEQEVSPMSHGLRQDIHSATDYLTKTHSANGNARKEVPRFHKLPWRKSFPRLKPPTSQANGPASTMPSSSKEQAKIDIRSLKRPMTPIVECRNKQMNSVSEQRRPSTAPNAHR